MRAAALLLLGAALTACSGGGDNPPAASPGPTSSATTTPSPSPSPTAEPPGPTDPLSPRPAVESPAPVGQPTCRPAALTVTDADQLDVDEFVHEVYVLRTTGAPCQLRGWPAVRFLDAGGQPLVLESQRGGFGIFPRAPKTVTLTRDTSMSFLVGTRRDGDCRQAATLVVTLPGTDQPLRATTGLSLCGPRFGVSPVQRLFDQE